MPDWYESRAFVGPIPVNYGRAGAQSQAAGQSFGQAARQQQQPRCCFLVTNTRERYARTRRMRYSGAMTWDASHRSARREAVRRYVSRSIRFRVRLYVVVFAIALVGAGVGTIRIGGVAIWFALAGLLVGVTVGVLASRITRLRWDSFARRVVGKIDAVGAIVLVSYLLLAVYRSRIVDIWVHGPTGAATSLAVLAGMMAGQVLGIQYGLSRLYRAAMAHGELGIRSQ